MGNLLQLAATEEATASSKQVKRAAIYLRISLDQHSETQGIQLRELARQRGYQTVEEFWTAAGPV